TEEEPAEAALLDQAVEPEVEPETGAVVGRSPLGVAGAHDDVVEGDVTARLVPGGGGESPRGPTDVEAVGVADEPAPAQQLLRRGDVLDAEDEREQSPFARGDLDVDPAHAEAPPRGLRGGDVGTADDGSSDPHRPIITRPGPRPATVRRRGSRAAPCRRARARGSWLRRSARG